MWDATTFTKNRDRLLAGEIAGKFLATVLAQKPVKALLSSEHFSVDGTLLEAWASPRASARRTALARPLLRTQRRTGFSWSEAQQRDPRFDHRSRRPARPQGTWQGGEVVLHRPCADGEPQWADCRRGGDPRIRPCRAAGGGTLDRAARRAASTHHCRRRQGLRQCGLHRRDARDQHHPAHRPERQPAPLRHRWPHHAPCRLRRQHVYPKTHREAFGRAKTVAGLRKARHRGLPKIDWQFTFTICLQSHPTAKTSIPRTTNQRNSRSKSSRSTICRSERML